MEFFMSVNSTCIYLDDALSTARIACSHWQREPASPSFGSFDRQYWGWKKKDVSDATLQAAVTLCVRYAVAHGQANSLPVLLDGYVTFLERIQHGNGSLDQIYPYERAPGVVHDLLTPLIWLWQSPHLDAATRVRLEKVIHKGVAYALTSDEKHGEIANHFAHYAWELIHYGKTFGHAEAQAYGERYLERTLALFNPKEGWFREYDGADAGYQTRLLSFLTRIAALTENESLWAVCEKAAAFVDAMLMPNNTLHPMLGVRSTALIYPSGFERLAARNAAFAPLAERIYSGWLSGATPRSFDIDFENGLRIAEDTFEATTIRQMRLRGAEPIAPQKTLYGDFDFSDAGLHRRTLPAGGNASRAIMFAPKLGGVLVVYDRKPDSWHLAYEDAGYLLHLSDGTRWLVRRAGAGQENVVEGRQLRSEAAFEQALHEDLTPFKLIVLRILNLTLLRSQWIGDVFKKIVVRRLISGHKRFPLVLKREITITDLHVTVTDRLVAGPGLAKRLGGARLYRCRRTIGNHMASSRYYQPDDFVGSQKWLEPIPLEVLDGREILRQIPIVS
jgi:hypothetical protein